MANDIGLSTWWQRDDAEVVAFNQHTTITVSTFKHTVAAWIEVLAPMQGSRFAVYHQDAASFLAILCALWQLSRTACVPGDALPGTVSRIKDSVDGFIGQFDMPEAVRTPKPGKQLSEGKVIDWEVIPQQQCLLEVYTSGTTGEPKAFQKTLQMIADELQALQTMQTDSLPAKVIATVSHQHFYGMTFRLLRPFVSGMPFSTYITEYLEDVIAEADDAKTFSLVSSPAHLSRFNEHLDWKSVEENCIEVISSAAPLKREDSLMVQANLNAPVKEVFGSSETGAIAWRVQKAEVEYVAAWQPLPHLSLSSNIDDTLLVESRNCNQAVVSLADQVVFNDDGSFGLLGRVDQLVKVEGKRVSLLEVERLLEDVALVSEAKVVMLSNKRAELAAALCLTESGVDVLTRKGKKSLIAQLKLALKPYLETVAIPRRWRFVSTFPTNTQGKVTTRLLTALFVEKQPKYPQVLNVSKQEKAVQLQCYIPRNLLYFDGHFDAQGVLPGVVQVHWATELAKQYLNFSGGFQALEKIKFQKVIFPDEVVALKLAFNTESKKLTFSYQSGDEIFSSGKISYV